MLIYDSEERWDSIGDADFKAIFEEYGAYTRELQEQGKLLGSSRLQPSSTAVSVQVRDGETLTTDGPFAETKEQLGGYYLIEADSLEDALAWAAKIPSARDGTIEVRPVMTRNAGVAA